MVTDYPISFDAIREWATTRNVSEAEGRVRFAQYGILQAVAHSRELSRLLVFKGGNALDFVWQPNRSTTDLDFSIDMTLDGSDVDDLRLRELFDGALFRAGRSLNIAFRAQSIRRNPPSERHTFATYQMKIAYALQDQRAVIQMIERQQPTPHVVDLDISLNDVVCESSNVNIGGTHPLRTCTIEDIIAEKLRALLQQPIRNRNRAQDLLDIAVCLRDATRPIIDRTKVAVFLQQKSEARFVPVSIAAFHREEVLTRARSGYDELQHTTRVAFISYDEAVSELHQFVGSLSIAEE